MSRMTFCAAALVAIAGSLALTNVADAKIKQFSGTRDQVRSACSSSGGELIEGVDNKGVGISICINDKNDTLVICNDNGGCHGYTPGRTGVLGVLQPDLAGGGKAYGTLQSDGNPVLLPAKPQFTVRTPDVQEAPPAPAPKLGVLQIQ